MKRIIAVLLAVLALSMLLVACGGDQKDNPTQAETAAPTEAGAAVIPTDAKGEPVYPTDAQGYPVYPTDANGEPVYATDAQGHDIIAVDGSGNPIPANRSDSNTSPTRGSDSSSSNPDSTPAVEPTEGVEGDIPVVIATIPDDEDLYELPILD